MTRPLNPNAPAFVPRGNPNNPVNYDYRPRGGNNGNRRRRNNNGNARRNSTRSWRGRNRSRYNFNGQRIEARRPRAPDNNRRNFQDQLVSARRNNKTVLASQQENMIGSDGVTYGLKNSQNGRKDKRQVSKKVRQNSNLTEANMGNYSDAHSEIVANLKSVSTDFSDFLLRQACWWIAQGWYVAIRKSYIKMGPASQNDKYFVNLADPFGSHRDAVFFPL